MLFWKPYAYESFFILQHDHFFIFNLCDLKKIVGCFILYPVSLYESHCVLPPCFLVLQEWHSLAVGHPTVAEASNHYELYPIHKFFGSG